MLDVKTFMMLAFPIAFLAIVNMRHLDATRPMKIGLFGLLIIIGYMMNKIIDESERYNDTRRCDKGIEIKKE
jgi:hypothetical protein